MARHGRSAEPPRPGIPEEYGGEGFGYAELALVLEETGAALLPGPYFSSAVVAASVLVQCGDDTAKARYLPGIASGRTIATLALTERSGRWDFDGIETRAEPSADGWTLHGTKYYVPDGVVADLLLVVARADTGVGVFCVDDTSTLDRRLQSTLDPTRRQAVVHLASVPAARLDASAADLERALAHAAAALAAEQVGGAQRCLDQAVGYAKVVTSSAGPRVIPSHPPHLRGSDAGDRMCPRRSPVRRPRRRRAPRSTSGRCGHRQSACTEAHARAAAANIQLHGGIGFTWEHPAHMYFKRAKSSAMLLGDANYHRRLLADRVGL